MSTFEIDFIMKEVGNLDADVGATFFIFNDGEGG